MRVTPARPQPLPCREVDVSRFQIYQDAEGYWRWRLIAANGEAVASGEAYTRQADARRAVADVKAAAYRARVERVEAVVGEGLDVAGETDAAERAGG